MDNTEVIREVVEVEAVEEAVEVVEEVEAVRVEVEEEEEAAIARGVPMQIAIHLQINGQVIQFIAQFRAHIQT